MEQENERKLCDDCNSFYGTKVTLFKCSSCYKKHLNNNPQLQEEIKKKEEEKKQEENNKNQEQKTMEEEQPQKPVQENKERCWNCNRKCGIGGIECKCGYVFCSKHRLPESHNCGFDHKGLARNNNTKKLENGHTQKNKLEDIDSK